MVRRTNHLREMVAVGYVRRSTDRQEQSIPDQKQAIESYIEDQSLTLLKFYVDDAISGTSTLGRRAFLQMVADAESAACSFSKIIVYDVKRFGRIDNDEAGYYRHKLKTQGIEIIYVSEDFNGDYTDDLLRPVKQWQARQESKDLSKVTIRGLLSKAEGGWWMGGVPPYGYDLRYENADGRFLLVLRYQADKSKQILDEQGNLTRTLGPDESIQVTKKDRARLVPGDPQRVEVVKEIFNCYTNLGQGFKAIAATLNRRSVPTARTAQWSRIYSGKWTDTTVRAILVNPLYAGDMVWNRRTDARFHKISAGRAVARQDIHGARLVPNDQQDWIVIRDNHEPLVSHRVWEHARERREGKPASIEQRGRNPRLKTHGKTWSGQRSRFILSGLITCAHCNSRYQGVSRAKGRQRPGQPRIQSYSYACGGYITKGKQVCAMNSIAQELLERTVIDTVLAHHRRYLQSDGREHLAQAVKDQLAGETEDVTKAKARATAEHSRIESIINNLLDNLTETNRPFVDLRLGELSGQKQQLETRLVELDRLETSQAEIQGTITDALQFLASLDYTLNHGVPQEKLAALRQCIQRIWIDVPNRRIRMNVFAAPVANLSATTEIIQTVGHAAATNAVVEAVSTPC